MSIDPQEPEPPKIGLAAMAYIGSLLAAMAVWVALEACMRCWLTRPLGQRESIRPGAASRSGLRAR